jgi:hypothetical protein
MKKLTPEQRSEIAKKAVAAREAKRKKGFHHAEAQSIVRVSRRKATR